MPLAYKPHTIIRWVATDHVDPATLTVGGVLYGAPETLRGQLTPMTAKAAMEKTGVEMDRPHLWMWDSVDDISPEDLIQFGDRFFSASSPQEIWDAEPTTACRTIVLSEIDADTVLAANEDL